MQRKPGFPVANCSIKMPDNLSGETCEEEGDQQQRRQQLINFGHTQWGFNNWNWAVTKQELDFVDQSNGKYCAGVVAFVSISVKNIDISRENIGYATSVANNKGFAIYKSRKVAVTNALRETMLSFGGAVATELTELLETTKEIPSEPLAERAENNQSIANTNIANTNIAKNLINTNNLANTNLANNLVGANITKTNIVNTNLANTNLPTNHPKPLLEGPPLVKNLRNGSTDPGPANVPQVKNSAPVAMAHPMPVSPAARAAPRPPPVLPASAVHPRPNSNVSFVLQPVMGSVVPPMYAPPRLAPPQIPPVYPNYYECGPWHFYEPHGNVNLNFNMPPKNLVVNSRAGSVECKNQCQGEYQYGPQQNRACWVKPTIYYDGFWTEQKVKKWVAEQVEKQFPDEQNTPSPHKDVKQ